MAHPVSLEVCSAGPAPSQMFSQMRSISPFAGASCDIAHDAHFLREKGERQGGLALCPWPPSQEEAALECRRGPRGGKARRPQPGAHLGAPEELSQLCRGDSCALRQPGGQRPEVPWNPVLPSSQDAGCLSSVRGTHRAP